MARHDEKPSTPGEALKHHGVKGMRWGHRKEDDTGGGGSSGQPGSAGSSPSATGRKPSSSAIAKEVAASNSSVKMMMAEASRMGHPPSEATLMDEKQKWLNKFAPDDSSPAAKRVRPMAVPQQRKKLTPTQKKILKNAAIGVGVVGSVYLLNKQAEKALGINAELKDHLKNGTLRGKPIGPEQFNSLTTYSQLKTWSTGNHIRPQSWAREGFTLDVGHEFSRLSQFPEKDFTKPTYSVANAADWNRYLTNFRHEKGPGAEFHHVTWKLTEPVKVPALKDVISTMQDVLKEEGKTGSEKEAVRAYQALSGGGWTNSRSQNLTSALKKKGYGALIDEMDAGVIGDRPLVFFDHKAATPKVSKPLSAAELKAAEAKVVELLNRKP